MVLISFIGYFADKLEFISQLDPMYVELGDDSVPHGLWRAIEHMRKGEKSLVMIKPKWGYGYKAA